MNWRTYGMLGSAVAPDHYYTALAPSSLAELAALYR
jgi:hypothetical protein